ncbi:MAG: OmpA family protein [Oscillospiraceae bacterium]|nr:OmpA family protein [Oscillospiraceae bacterium]
MKNNVKRILRAAAAAAACALMSASTGCSLIPRLEPEQPEPLNMAIILGEHSNAYQPDITLLEDDLLELAERGGSFIVVVSDGDPASNHSVVYPVEPPDTSLPKATQKKHAEQTAADMVEILRRSEAETAGVDTLGAIKVASRNIASETGEKRMSVLDSGYSESGCAALVSLVRFDSDCFVKTLQENQNLPDLSGFESVRWYGLNSVCEPQPAPTDRDRNMMHQLWTKILENSGAENVQFIDKDYTEQIVPEGLPSVASIEMNTDLNPADRSITPEEIEEEPVRLADTPIAFPESNFPFKANSSELLHPDEAEKLVQPVVQALNAECNKDIPIVLVGCCAMLGPENSARELSGQRAGAIRDLLIRNGVEESRISIVGVGYSSDLHLDEHNPDGTINDERKAANRTVYLMTLDEGQKYLNS